jgi:glycosyltransferase involved in cell wall biosynthesis
MNILWHSVAPWVKTGYGIQTALFTSRLRDLLGHNVAIFAYAGLEVSPLRMDGMLILPKGHDRVGADMLREHARMWDADLVITLTDSWVVPPDAVRGLPWAPWVPIDHDPVPPMVSRVLRESGALPIAMSRFGERRLKAEGLDPIYIPHACHPAYLEREERTEARRELEIPEDAFVIGVVGVNQGVLCRKGLPQAIEAFATFNRRHSDAFLYLHTDLSQVGGIDMRPLFDLEKIERTRYRVPDRYQYSLGFTEDYMRLVYHAVDVLLLPSMGEGFGVPVIEAQACGAPVIVTDFTALPELCFYGELLDPGQRVYTPQGAYQALPRVQTIVDALEDVYNYSETTRQEGSERARAAVLEHFHPDRITQQYWNAALKLVKDRFD